MAVNTQRTTSEICRNEEDWIALREVFVRAFVHYPLYQYIVRDEHNRAEFLRRYLTAHYNIHVKSGRSPLICIRAREKHSQQSNASQQILKGQDEVNCHGDKIVGGVLFVAPARNGIGWDCEEERIYEKAYAEVELCDVDAEAFERLQRYEAWEEKNIYSSILGLKMPLWLGMFCAADPEHSGNGYGSEVYSDCIKIIKDFEAKRQKMTTKSGIAPTENGGPQDIVSRIARLCGFSTKAVDKKEEDSTSRLLREPPVRFLHAMSLLSHHAHIHSVPSQSKAENKSSSSSKCSADKKSRDIPLLMALSHSSHAVQFHIKHGFNCVRSLPFFASDFGESPFTVHVLVSDIFGAHRLNEIALKLANSNEIAFDEKDIR